MKQNINKKAGDVVPVNRSEYFIVEKPFVAPEITDEDEDYSFYKVGDHIVIRAGSLEQYVPSFKEFVKNNCRTATANETNDIYKDLYSNARIGDVYDDGSYQIHYFFIVESHLDELWEKFEIGRASCRERV